MTSATPRLRIRKKVEHRSPRSRRSQQQISYHEASSDNENFESSRPAHEQSADGPSTPRKSQITRPVTRSQQLPRMPRAKRQKRVHKKNTNNVVVEVTRASNDLASNEKNTQDMGKRMRLDSLPYHLLTSVIAHACGPLVDHERRQPSVRWLLRFSKMSKAFTEPCLSVLYYSPPIDSLHDVKSLLSLLQQESSRSMLRYRAKIRCIELYSPFKWMGRSSKPLFLDLCRIVKLAPLLRNVHCGVPAADAKQENYYGGGPHGVGYVQQEAILADTINEAGISLDEWTWKWGMSPLFSDFQTMKNIHGSSSFQSLRSLTMNGDVIVNSPSPTPSEPGEDSESENVSQRLSLVNAINEVSTLKQLQLFRVHLMGPKICDIQLSLESLVIVDCEDITSVHLEDFLRHGGRSLKELVVKHNSSLNLSFLTVLSMHCPLLEALQVDLLYHRSRWTSRYRGPYYDILMEPHETATWPSSLRRLELLHLQQWSLAIADRLFSSLVDHADDLLNLRHLKIKASLEESNWRERSRFRGKWESEFQQVFLRRSSPIVDHHHTTSSTSRPRSVVTDDESQPGSAVGTSRRKSQRLTYNEDSSDEEGSSFEDGGSPMSIDRRAGRQGRCDVVDITLDNQRPTEDQKRESDFLDDEVSGDEDWNGD